MAEKTKQKWDTVICPRRGFFDIDVKGLVHYRDLILLLVKQHFTVMYRQTILGPMWVILQPLMTTIIFTVVFGNLAGLPTDGLPKFLFYMSGNTLWSFFSSCLTTSANTFVHNRKLFGKVYFPRLCMPIATVFSEIINFMVQFVLFLAFVIYYATRPNAAVCPNLKLMLLTPLLLLQLGFLGAGFGIIVSALTTRYRDLAMLVNFGVRLWMYLSPVTYSSTLVMEKAPQLLTLYMLNPIAPIINLFRAAFLGGTAVTPVYNLISVGTTLLILLLGIVLFSHTEKTFMDTI